MDLTVINDLPAHILFVHAVIILVPLSALLVTVGAIWPRAAWRLGLLLPILTFSALVSVPLASHAGEWLEEHVQETALVEQHAELGDGLLPWVLALFLLSLVVWWAARGVDGRQTGRGSLAGRLASAPLRIAAVVLVLGVAVGSVVDVYRIGDSGAKAAWQDRYSTTSVDGADGDDD